MFRQVIPIRFIFWLIGVILTVLLFVWSATTIYQKGFAEAEALGKVAMQVYKAEQQKIMAEQLEKQLKINEQLREEVRVVQMEKEDAIKAIIEQRDALVASLQQRPSRASRVEPSIKIETPIRESVVSFGTASTGKELYREDGEFLAGEAASADVLREALLSCRSEYEAAVRKVNTE